MKRMLSHRSAKTVSITLICMAIGCSVINGARQAILYKNPIGLALNVMLIIFLVGGIMFILKDQKNDKRNFD